MYIINRLTLISHSNVILYYTIHFVLPPSHAVPPKVRAEQEEVITGVSFSATLACFVEAEPKAKVNWYRLGDIPVDPLRLTKKVDVRKRYVWLYIFFLHYKSLAPIGFYGG